MHFKMQICLSSECEVIDSITVLFISNILSNNSLPETSSKHLFQIIFPFRTVFAIFDLVNIDSPKRCKYIDIGRCGMSANAQAWNEKAAFLTTGKNLLNLATYTYSTTKLHRCIDELLWETHTLRS